MPINKERIRQKLANLASGGNAASFWSPPKEGSAVIRLFEIPEQPDPFLELFFHFNINKQSIYCPKKNGKANKCAICDLAEEMFRGDAEDREMSKKLYAKPRYYAAVIDRSDESLTPKYWGFGKQNYTRMLKWLAEDGGDYEHFMDVHEGLDLVVTVTKTPGKDFADTTIDCKRRESPLCPEKELKRILTSLKSPDELWPCPSQEEIQSKLDAWLSTDTEETESQKPVSVPAQPERHKGNNVGSVEQLNSLFETALAD